MNHTRTFAQWVTLYVFGFGVSLLLSVISYLVITMNGLGDNSSLVAAALLGLATAQLIVQLICFLHLGTNPRSIFKTHTFIFTFVTMLIVVIGSLWIMKNLDYRMDISPESVNEYMFEQNKKGF